MDRIRSAAVAAIAAGVCTPALGQFVEVVASQSVVDITSGAQTIDISIWADRAGSTDGFFADFGGWAFVEGHLFATSGLEFIAPTENNADDSDGLWHGRRPTSDPTLGPLGPGSWRMPNTTQFYRALSVQDAIASGRDIDQVAAGFVNMLASTNSSGTTVNSLLPYGNDLAFSPYIDATERIELFRTQAVVSETGSIEIAFLYLDTAPNTQQILVSGINQRRYVDIPTLSTTITVVPAPGVLALLAPALCVRRRRA